MPKSLEIRRIRLFFAALFLGVFAIQLLIPTQGHAQQRKKQPPAKAVELYKRGRANYEAGRYREAVGDLKAALQLDPYSPNLVYNVARVSELLGELSEAIYYYRRYLSLLKPSEVGERARIEKTIRRLEGAKNDSQTPSSETEPLSTEVSSELSLEAMDPLFWATAGSGAALLLIGVVMGAVALDNYDETSEFVVGRDGSLNDRNSLASDTNLFALLADIGLISGSVLLAGAGLLFFLRQPETQTSESHLPVDVGFNGRNAWLKFTGSL
jgi:tetratricopeptide (TPR) repeat protein